MTTKKRDFAIDLIKFLAVLLIINSHMDKCYPSFRILATGGAIGDALFLFCSGFTLFWGKMQSFDNFFKRRINRIYPSVFASVIVKLAIGFYCIEELTATKILGGEFVIAIMLYYAIFWFIRSFAPNKIPTAMVLLAVMVLICYYFYPFKYETGVNGLYGTSSLFRWLPYTGIFLMGAYIGKKVSLEGYTIKAKKIDLLYLLLCLVTFYGIQFVAKAYQPYAPYQIATIPFLYCIVFLIYKICKSEHVAQFCKKPVVNNIIMIVGGLCLESYLIQFAILTNALNFLFPLNLVIMVLLVLVAAYIVRCIARIFSQTFRTEDYEWNKVFSLK